MEGWDGMEGPPITRVPGVAAVEVRAMLTSRQVPVWTGTTRSDREGGKRQACGGVWCVMLVVSVWCWLLVCGVCWGVRCLVFGV